MIYSQVFIRFDGPTGAGKTLLSDIFLGLLRAHGIKVETDGLTNTLLVTLTDEDKAKIGGRP